MKTITLVFVGAALLIFLISGYVSTSISYKNREATLRELYSGKVKNQANVFDAMWKIIAKKAQLTENYKQGFAETLTNMVDSRYSKGDGSLMKWVQEQNPTLPPALYIDLANTIESQSMGFVNEQKELIDIANQYNILIAKFPGSWFLSDRQRIDVKLITSSKTESVQASGKDNDVDLFKTAK